MRHYFHNWGASTLGHLIIFNPMFQWETVWPHEFVHVRQSEDVGLLGFVLGILVTAFSHSPFLGLAVWLIAVAGAWQSAGLMSLVRGTGYYSGNENEKAAYAEERRLERL